jgi:DNA primase
VSLAEVVAERVELKRSGTLLVGLCPSPSHNERTPSFTVREDLGRYKCYGCGERGDIIDFLELVDGVSFLDAVQQVADRAGLPIPGEPRQHRGPPERALRAALADAHTLFIAHLTDDSAADARRYLHERKFTDEHINQWGLGYSPGSTTILTALRARGHSDEVLRSAGLTKRSQHGYRDVFSERLIWPLHDSTGRLCGFAGRALNPRQRAKYLNTEDNTLFHKRATLFGLWPARQPILSTRAAVVVEGYTDVMAFAAAGHPNVVATCGTAVTEDHVRLLSSRVGDDGEIISAFDHDPAGLKATWELFLRCQHFTSHINVVNYSRFGDKADACDVRQQDGDTALSALLEAKVPALQMLIQHDCQLPDTRSPEDVVSAARRANRRLSEVTSPILRRAYQEVAADLLDVTIDDLVAGAPPPQPDSRSPRPDHEQPISAIVNDDHILLAASLISDPHTWASASHVTGGCTLQDLFDNPIALMIEVSWAGFRDGRPTEGDDASVWAQYMQEVTEPEHHEQFWDIAFCDSLTSADSVNSLAVRVRRLRLHRIIEETRSDPTRHNEYMLAYRALRDLRQQLAPL